MKNHPLPTNLAFRGFLLALFGCIFFSTKAILVKLAFFNTAVDPVTLLTLRMLFACPFYVMIAFYSSQRKLSSTLTIREWISVILIGAVGYYVSSYFDFVGLLYISAALERVILFLYPTFVLLINSAVFRQKVSGIQIISILLTYAGILLAYYSQLKVNPTPDFLFGSVMVLLCAVTYSFYIIGSGIMIPKIGITKFTAYAMLAAVAGVFIHFLISKNFTLPHISADYWLYGSLLGIVATVIPSFMLSGSLKYIGSNNVALISTIGPVSTILQAHLFLGERIDLQQIAGTILVLLGVAITAFRVKAFT